MSIPLNSLYIDLTSDEKITNDSDEESNNVIDLFKSIVINSSPEYKQNLIESLKSTEPFCNYLEEIEDAQERGAFDD